MPLTKKLPTLVKTIPIGVTFIAAGISTYSVEYKKICNIYPHETIFRVQDIPFSSYNQLVGPYSHMEIPCFSKIENGIVPTKPILLEALNTFPTGADVFVDYSQIVPNDLVYRPFCSNISEHFVNHLYHLYLNHDLQAIIDFLYTYHALSYAETTRLLMCIHEADVMTYESFKLFLGV
jgi:hypothetical protein